MVKFNKKSHFPYTYGDSFDNDGVRLSDWIVSRLSDKRLHSHLGVVFLTVIALGSQAPSAQAIPPEYDEFAAQATKDVAQELPGIPKIPKEIPQVHN